MASTDVALDFDKVSKTFGEGEEAVHAIGEVDIDIDDGEFVSIVGPSGCGKSTMLNITAGLHNPTSGAVRFQGEDMRDLDLTGDIGFVFQSPVLLDWRTVRQNILLPVKIMLKNGDIEGDVDFYEARTDELIELVGLEGFGDAFPRELSGGMQQRVSLCQCLVYDPSILLMDEPFGALDALTKDKMNAELLELWRETQKTILFVTHDLSEAVYLSDRVLVLTERPANVARILEVDLERPREEEIREQPEFHDLVAELNTYFR